MSATAVRVGLVGCGAQSHDYYVPYLADRAGERHDVRVAWVSGYLPADHGTERIERMAREFGCRCAPGDAWTGWLGEADAVIVSLPNALHGPAIRAALAAGVHVAVDKPPTVCPDECAELVRLAGDELVFVTISQRRYEHLYQTVKGIVERGGVGNLLLAEYLLSHPHHDRGRRNWATSRAMAGGGSLIQSGFHGLDTLLWLSRHTPPAFGGPARVESVSAEVLYERDPAAAGRDGLYAPAREPADPDQVESVACVRMRLSTGGLFGLTASYANPRRSVDEVFKIIGDRGMIRSTRERPNMTDRKPGRLSYQDADGELTEFDTAPWNAMRSAPVADFLDAVIRCRAGEPWAVLAPAAESVETLRVIRAAYRSAADGGREVRPDEGGPTARPLHHVAVQTGRYRDALRFYTEILGMRVLQDGPFKRRTVAWLQAGNTRVELFSNRSGEDLAPWSDRVPGPIHLAFEVPNLREFLAWARGRGAGLHPSHPEPFVPPVPGAKEIAYLLGPDGEEVEIRERD